MATPDLFVGVVSHAATRFPVSQGPDGLAMRLAAALPGTVVQVNTENASGAIPVTPRTVQASLTAELRAEARWDSFLGRSARYRAVLAARWAKRGWQRLKPPAPRTVRRLLDIELSHRDLMGSALASGAPWALIVEDDGFADDDADLAAGIRGLVGDPGRRPAYVVLSRSFGTDALRIGHLLREGKASWAGDIQRRILESRLPVTNTVCATLYSRAFLAALVPVWDGLPMEPVVPVDWKLNLALMRMHEAGLVPEYSCWLVEPGPIVQGSMHDLGAPAP